MYEPLKDFILNGASTGELKQEAMKLGFKTLRQSAVSHLIEGVTTIEEVTRVTVNDE